MHLDSSTDVFDIRLVFTWIRQQANRLDALKLRKFQLPYPRKYPLVLGRMDLDVGQQSFQQLAYGYTKQDESRGAIDKLFPAVRYSGGRRHVYFIRSEPFTPNNDLRYKSLQVRQSSYFAGKHTFTGGVSLEKYESENVFFPGRRVLMFTTR